MNFLKIISFLIITSVFIGNIGSTIFIHHCEKEGDSFSIFKEVEHSCDVVVEKSCCSIEKKDDACCSDEIKQLKSDVKIFKVNKNFKLNNQFIYFSDFQILFSEKISRELDFIIFYDPPPLFYNVHINILNQVFQI